MIRFKISSSQDTSTAYNVWGKLVGKNDSIWQCECKSWAYRRKCRHVELAKRCLLDGVQRIEVVDD